MGSSNYEPLEERGSRLKNAPRVSLCAPIESTFSVACGEDSRFALFTDVIQGLGNPLRRRNMHACGQLN